ncbi:MAG TPA: transglutaminase domain-containing protein [Panacibacter sp.]|nr:transglutaminase domain-containing protein [Panacibacter sp.]HNP45400.1 transglutaminase domain-containing protein [Panacibacter sp.]
MKTTPVVFSLALVLLHLATYANPYRPAIKYGDVKPTDFAPIVYSVDSSANALYLFDVGDSHYEENTGGLSVVFSRHARIRLMNKNGFDLATVEIPIYQSKNFEERLDDFSAATYNIENGNVMVTKVDKGSLFKDKDDNEIVYKFTFPNLKEGSIVEFKYKVTSPSAYFIEPWYFQKDYPKLWSEYSVALPEFYDFVQFQQGYLQLATDTSYITNDNFNSYRFNSQTIHHTWAIENVPSLKEEEFTTTLSNHIAKVEFQLAAIRFPNAPMRTIMSSWQEVADELLKDEDFAADLQKENNWLNDDIKKATAGATTNEEKGKKIFEFVRDHFTCTDNYAVYISQPIKKTYQAKKGNVADINMLLTAMMLSAGFEAHPVLLSTRKHGKTYDLYPIMNKFNYVISQVIIDGKSCLLDASDPDMSFKELPAKCYNGNARVIAELPVIVDLSADSLMESKLTTVFMTNDVDSTGKYNGIVAAFSTQLGKFESQDMRQKLKSTKENDYFQEIKKAYSIDVELSNTEIDSLKIPAEPITVKYDIKISPGDDDIFYFNPLLAEAYKENPFKAAERLYPVEMPYCSDETYILNMEVPKGYVIDELPKSARVKLNEDEGMFEYIIAVSGDRIQLRCRTVIKKANFEPGDYQTLRDFFAYVVKKQAEQIVFKKQ